MINDIEIINDYTILQHSKIIIYGTGKRGRDLAQLLELIDAHICGYCDSDITKKGNLINDYIVYNLVDLKESVDKNTIIIVASMYFEEIISSLQKYDLESYTFTCLAAEIAIYLNYKKMQVKNKQLLIAFLQEKISALYKEAIITVKADMLECFLDINNQNILIYQLGKVGSTTLVDSIEAGGIHTSHCHSLFSLPSVNENVKLNEYRNKIISNYTGKIIIPIREPIARDISQYFQLLWVRLGVLCKEYNIQNIIDGFFEIYYYSLTKKTTYDENTGLQAVLLNSSCYGPEFDWFHCELKNFLGVDIFDYPFDAEAGYSIYQINGCNIMILQLEKMNSLEKVIGEFCGISDFKLLDSNTSDSKEYQYLYKNFKEQLRLPQGYIDFYYKDNPSFAHFYSESQRNDFFTKWMKKCNNK